MSEINAVTSLNNDILRLINQQEDLKKQNQELEALIKIKSQTLDNLRNDQSRIEGEIAAFRIEKKDYTLKKIEDMEKNKQAKDDLLKLQKKSDDTLDLARKTKREADEKFDAVQEKIRAAEEIETRNREALHG